ncbi:MAG: hypothetical protein IPH09_12980, partial [bacterium]|nr:hypothetical protein [bacterium]
MCVRTDRVSLSEGRDADSTLFYKASAADSTGWYCIDKNVVLNSADIDTLELSGIYNVKAYGAIGNGIANDTAAIQAALTAAATAGGGEVYFPKGTYLCGSALTVGDYVNLRGVGKVATTIKRGFTGDFITAFGGKSSIKDMTIDGDTATRGAGTGITITSLKPAQFFSNIEIINFVESCIEFPIDSGSQSHIIGCRLYTTGAVNTVAAVTVLGTDTQATPRHYIGNEGSGCTLYDFGGCSDVFVTGGYTANLIFGAASNKVFINNMRIGAAGDTVRVRGASHRITGCVSAIPFRVGGTGHDIDCEAPDWSFTDISANSMIDQRLVTFTPAWTGASSNPAIGNGAITCSYSRDGSVVTAFYSLSIGSSTTFGSGVWRFALPQMDNSSVVCAGGSGFTSDVPDSNLTFVTRTQ